MLSSPGKNFYHRNPNVLQGIQTQNSLLRKLAPLKWKIFKVLYVINYGGFRMMSVGTIHKVCLLKFGDFQTPLPHVRFWTIDAFVLTPSLPFRSNAHCEWSRGVEEPSFFQTQIFVLLGFLITFSGISTVFQTPVYWFGRPDYLHKLKKNWYKNISI